MRAATYLAANFSDMPFFTYVLWSLVLLPSHDFHVSITRVVQRGEVLQVTGRYFSEDLEAALSRQTGQSVRLNAKAAFDAALHQYILNHTALRTADTELRARWLGYELENELCFVYYEYRLPQPVDRLAVENRVLFDSFTDQSNIVNVERGEQLQSAFLKPGQPSVWLQFNP